MPRTLRLGQRRRGRWCRRCAGLAHHHLHRRSHSPWLHSNPILEREATQLLSTLLGSHIPSPLHWGLQVGKSMIIDILQYFAKATSVLERELPPYSPPATINICKYQNISTQTKAEFTDLGCTDVVCATGMLKPIRPIIQLRLRVKDIVYLPCFSVGRSFVST